MLTCIIKHISYPNKTPILIELQPRNHVTFCDKQTNPNPMKVQISRLNPWKTTKSKQAIATHLLTIFGNTIAMIVHLTHQDLHVYITCLSLLESVLEPPLRTICHYIRQWHTPRALHDSASKMGFSSSFVYRTKQKTKGFVKRG